MTFTAVISTDPGAYREALAQAVGPRSPFQDPRWVELWYERFCASGDVPQVLSVFKDGGLAVCLPLVRRRKYGLPLVEFADRGVTDYNIPLQGPAYAVEDEAALWQAVSRAALPYARLQLTKMPREWSGRPVPLTRLASAVQEDLVGNLAPKGASAEDYAVNTLGSRKRKDLERRWRVLRKTAPTAEFRHARTDAEKRAVFDLVTRSQASRIPCKGSVYLLGQPPYSDFCEAVALRRNMDDHSLLSAIWIGDEPIMGSVGMRAGGCYVVTRLGIVERDELMKIGLGKLLFFELGKWASETGLARFDLSIGHGEAKRWFRAEPVPLVRLSRGVSKPKMPGTGLMMSLKARLGPAELPGNPGEGNAGKRKASEGNASEGNAGKECGRAAA